jgi:hypothetical protein
MLPDNGGSWSNGEGAARGVAASNGNTHRPGRGMSGRVPREPRDQTRHSDDARNGRSPARGTGGVSGPLPDAREPGVVRVAEAAGPLPAHRSASGHVPWLSAPTTIRHVSRAHKSLLTPTVACRPGAPRCGAISDAPATTRERMARNDKS